MHLASTIRSCPPQQPSSKVPCTLPLLLWRCLPPRRCQRHWRRTVKSCLTATQTAPGKTPSCKYACKAALVCITSLSSSSCSALGKPVAAARSAVHCRYDYQAQELGAVLELMACIKGLAALMERAQAWLCEVLAQAVHVQTHQFLQWALANTKPGLKVSYKGSLMHSVDDMDWSRGSVHAYCFALLSKVTCLLGACAGSRSSGAAQCRHGRHGHRGLSSADSLQASKTKAEGQRQSHGQAAVHAAWAQSPAKHSWRCSWLPSAAGSRQVHRYAALLPVAAGCNRSERSRNVCCPSAYKPCHTVGHKSSKTGRVAAPRPLNGSSPWGSMLIHSVVVTRPMLLCRRWLQSCQCTAHLHTDLHAAAGCRAADE